MALGDDADDEVEQGPVDGVTDRGDGAFGGEGQGHGACAVIRRGPVLDQDPLGNAVPFEGPERIFRTGSLSVEDAVDRLGSPLVRGGTSRVMLRWPAQQRRMSRFVCKDRSSRAPVRLALAVAGGISREGAEERRLQSVGRSGPI